MQPHAVTQRPRFRFRSWLPGTLLVALLLVGYVKAQAIADWFRLYSYQPPAAVVALADQTTMTPEARHLFYINKPSIDEKTAFRSRCPDYGEKTIVLGCYQGGQRGIHVLTVTDARLNGVEQVTAAHEMLHAAYDRLSGTEKTEVNRLLQDYADNQLKDERIKKVLQGYTQTEPGQELNEMHSIFGTEITSLPTPLENYYTRYFSNRTVVAQYAARYQAAFSSRQEQIAQYDRELKASNARIQANLKQLESQQVVIEHEDKRLDGLRASGDYDAYNAGVAAYNQQIESYNALLAATRADIEAYNKKVDVRNALANETAQLTQAIDSSVLPKQQ